MKKKINLKIKKPKQRFRTPPPPQVQPDKKRYDRKQNKQEMRDRQEENDTLY